MLQRVDSVSAECRFSHPIRKKIDCFLKGCQLESIRIGIESNRNRIESSMPPGSIPAHFKICAGSVAAGEATGSPISISILMLTCRGSYRIRSSPEYVTDMRSCNGESRELSNNNGGRPDAAETANSPIGQLLTSL